MENAKVYKSYCLSLGEALTKIVADAVNKKKPLVAKGDDLATGYLCAFHRVITLMQQQAEMYEIPFKELGIDIEEEEFF